jgi:formamidopyrimidine-DNA glycosylase
MPELPEVEIARRDLLRWLGGRRLVAAEATAGKPLRGATTPAAVSRLAGRTVSSIDRRGKHLLWKLDGGIGIHQHLGMTGKLVWRKRDAAEVPFSRVRFTVADGVVHFQDARRFGEFEIVPQKKLEALAEVRELGPDALEALPPASELRAALGSPRRPIKLALMDQSALAGIGNIQAAEILYLAKISPLAKLADLSDRQMRTLRSAIEKSLRSAIEEELPRGDSDIEYVEEGGRNPFRVYDREGEPCRRRDRAPIVRITQGGRSTYYCPFCQRA